MAFKFMFFLFILQILCKDMSNDYKIKSNNHFQLKNVEPINQQKLINQTILNDTYTKLSNFKINVFSTSSPERNLIFILIVCEIIVIIFCIFLRKKRVNYIMNALVHDDNNIYEDDLFLE